MHFSWFNLFPFIGHDYAHVASAVLAFLILAVMAFLGRKALSKAKDPLMPARRFSIKAFFELLIDFINSLGKIVTGESGHFSTPMFAALFLIILTNNLLGLIPGMTPATENMNAAFSIGICSFAMYNYYGFKYNGIAYLKHFVGPILLLAPMMLIIELISHIARPFSLGLRLSGNMAGDHTVLGIFLDLVPIGIPVLFYFLGIFVCIMQAFVFTILSMIYLSMSIAHDH